MLLPSDVNIYLYSEVTDMRKSIDTLCVLVADTLKLNPSSGHLFLFRNRQRNKLKALFYEQNSFTLWYRRLEKGKYVFPVDAQGCIEITAEHFQWLLASNKFSQWPAFECESYQNYF
jgi:transposase